MTEAPSRTSAAPGAELTQRLDQLLQPWNRSDAPGLVIGVAIGGRPVYRRGFGLASVEQRSANTPWTRMRIGSTSKHFASLAALLLAEDGKLDLDAPLRRYLPELSGVSGEPTALEMMRHTSGLRDPYDLPGYLLNGSYSTITCPGVGLELSTRFTSSNYPRGERMIYCNQGYHLLSLAIERISGQPFALFLQERVLAPLGMHGTQLLPSDMTMVPGIAALHVPQADGSYRRGVYPSEELLGSGGMVSTIDDMLKWLAHLRGEQKTVGSAGTWAQMLERPRYNSGASGDYCLGLVRESYRGVEIVHHAGAVIGGTCQMLTVPAHELDISLMYNRMDGPAPATALKVVDAVLGTALQPAEPPLRREGRERLPGRWYAPASRRLYGVIEQPLPDAAPVLALAIQGSPAGLLREAEGGLIMTSSAHGAVRLRLPAGGIADTLELTDSGHAERCVRLPESGPAAATLAPELVGRYRYADFGLELSIVLEQDQLYLDLQPRYGRSRFRLEPYSAEVCGCIPDTSWPLPLAALAGAVLIVERKAGAISGLWLNSMRTRNLRLDRLA